MTIAFDGWQSYLAVDVNSTDTTFVLGFDTDMPSVPFDFTIGLERCTATAHPSTNTLTVTRGVNSTPADVHFGGPECGVAEVRQQFLVYHGAALFCDLTAIAERCEVDYVMPGGMSQAVISFHTYDPTRYFPDPDAVLILSSNETGTFKPYGKGILGVPKETRFDDGSYHYELTFFGVMDTLGEDGDEYDQTRAPVEGYYDSGLGWWAAFTPIHQVITDAIRDLCFYTISLDFTHVVDGGQQIGKEFNGLWKTALQIINELCAQGDAGKPLDWAIFTDAVGGSVLYLYTRDRWNTINIPWNLFSTDPTLPDDLPFSWNTREQKTKVVMKYGAGTMPATAVAAGRPKSLHRDLSNMVQDAQTAYSIATTILGEVETLHSLTEKPVVFVYRADDPSTKYLTDNTGAEIPIWRGEDIIGRMAQIPGVTPTNPNWPITPAQIKTYHVSHTGRSGTAQLGKYVDWTAEINRYGFQDAQRPDSPIHTPGSSSAFAAPPDTLAPTGSTSVNVPTTDSSGYTGPHKVMEDLDMIPPQWSYVDPTGTPLPEGWYGDYHIHHEGHILGFNFRGTDGAQNPSSGVFEIWKGTGVGTPTLASTITVTGAILGDDIFPDDAVLEVLPGDYLRLRILTNDDTTGFSSVAVSAQLRRTGGTDRPTSSAEAVIEGISASRDATTGIVTFSITTDRPVRAWVAYGTQSGSYLSVTNATSTLTKNPKPQAFAVPNGVTMHGIATAVTADGVQTVGADFVF